MLGVALPAISGIIVYSRYTPLQIIAANIYFILVSYIIWSGCTWIHSKLRSQFTLHANPAARIIAFCCLCAVYGFAVGLAMIVGWFYVSKEYFSWPNILKFTAFCAVAVILFTLIYEVLFLSKERELDSRIVRQLDRERSEAEMHALRNELDPHFIFNSLTTLNHLIINNPQQAYLFNNKFAQVYKYYLINKTNVLISLRDELEFIDNYFFLLRIRHEDKLQLDADLDNYENILMIPPFALQILLENAIKHNEFTRESPLHIKFFLNGQYLKVSNNIKPKPYSVNSTGIGLKNLSSRYKILCNKDIEVEQTTEDFIVKLPLIKTL